MSQVKHPRDRIFVPLIVALSIVVPLAVAALFLLPEEMKMEALILDMQQLQNCAVEHIRDAF